MKRILFVDDEPHVLEGLRGLLRKQRKIWDMTFVGSADEALRELSRAPADVILSDMRMPVMDGAQLLAKVKELYPHTVRIVLSGQTEQEVSRRMVHVAHQFMSKPCDGNTLQQTIDRACTLQALLQHPSLREAVGKVGQLPIKPSLYYKLIEVLEKPTSSAADVAAVVERDVGASSKILQVVNSAFFGLPNRIGDIKQAVSYLGVEMVKSLALSVEMRSSQAKVKPVAGVSLDALQEHALRSGRLARKLLPDRTKAQDAFSAAMFQDAGVLVLMGMPETFGRIVEKVRETGRSLADIEQETLGVTHAEIGAYLLGIWGLPYSIVEGVAHHHAPLRAGSTTLDVVGAVHVASALAEELAPVGADKGVGPGLKLDEGYVESIGMTKQIPAWREIAKKELEGTRG